MSKRQLRVAIVHDWLIGGGAERVVMALHELYPDAPIYTSYCSDEWRKKLDNKVVTGFLQHKLFAKLRKYVPFLRIWWFTHLDLSQFDLVISSSGAEAKGIRVQSKTVHVNYCHAPTHYYWSRYEEYLAHPGFGPFDPLARLGLRILVGPLRHWDFRAAQRPTYMIANSTYTQEAIQRYYKRTSEVIFPPVELTRFTPNKEAARDHYVIAGRQTPYKRIDLAVAACTKASLPLRVIGRGPDHERLRSLAGPTVTFHTNINDDEIPAEFQSAKAFLFPGIDDFGIVAVEALASGTPLIAYRGGGVLDYVTEGKTGIFFTEQTVASLSNALTTMETASFNNAAIVRSVQRFAPETFKRNIEQLIDRLMQ